MIIRLSLLAAALAVTGCVHNSTNSALEVGSNQVQLRQIQSRAFDTTDKTKTLRTVISTLQDLGFKGFLIDDHVPLLDGDPEIVPGYVNSPYAFRGRAYANGYLQGMVKALSS